MVWTCAAVPLTVSHFFLFFFFFFFFRFSRAACSSSGPRPTGITNWCSVAVVPGEGCWRVVGSIRCSRHWLLSGMTPCPLDELISLRCCPWHDLGCNLQSCCRSRVWGHGKQRSCCGRDWRGAGHWQQVCVSWGGSETENCQWNSMVMKREGDRGTHAACKHLAKKARRHKFLKSVSTFG